MEFDSESLFRLVDVSGVVANGLLGGVAARAFRFDMIGFILLAVVTGMGGGMIRDVLLGHGFPVMLTDRAYLLGALIAAAVAFFIDLSGKWTNRALVLIDFFGMGCWTATGVTKALSLGLGWLPAVAMGVVTAVGGGMLRDVLLNRIPSIFGGSVLYATIAILSSALAATVIGVIDQPTIAMPMCIVLCPVLGVLSRWRRWTLPEPQTLSVPRPRLSWARPRTLRRLRGMGWVPGEPVNPTTHPVTAATGAPPTGAMPAQPATGQPGQPRQDGTVAEPVIDATGSFEAQPGPGDEPTPTGEFTVPHQSLWPQTTEFPAITDPDLIERLETGEPPEPEPQPEPEPEPEPGNTDAETDDGSAGPRN